MAAERATQTKDRPPFATRLVAHLSSGAQVWRVVRVALAACGALGLIGSPWWGPRALSQLDYFHVRRVSIEGLRYARPGELLALLRVDTTQSVWQALPPLAARALTHPLVLEAEVVRQLPGTVIVRVVERTPVALAPVEALLQPLDASAHVLPIDLTKVQLDVPILATPDSALLRVLDALRQYAAPLYARVSDAQRVGSDELTFTLGSLRIRSGSDVTVARFRDILPVEADLARNHLRALELDLRFRDQVIARLP